MTKKMIKVGHIDRAPDVYRVEEKDEIEITLTTVARRRSFTMHVEVGADGEIKIRGDGQITITPLAANLVRITRDLA